jgi:hypothetical protein
MSNPELSAYLPYLEKLIAETRNGTMLWHKANPTTFTWETNEPKPARLILQRIQNRARVRLSELQETKARPEPISIFILQALDLSMPGEAREVTSISGDKDSEVNGRLEQLYDSIKLDLSDRGLDFLKSIMPREANA